MNIGRFHAAIDALRNEVEKDDIIKHITELQTLLQQYITTPSEETSKTFKDKYKNIRSILGNAGCDKTFPTRIKIYEEIKATSIIGNGLLKRIDDTLTDNQMTPANALVDLKKITADINQYINNIKSLDDIFTTLNIEYDDLDPGEFEVGFSLPRKIGDSTVESLESEFKEIDYAFRTLQEISNDGGGSPEIRTLSASEWQIFINSLPETAACISLAVERIVALYKNNLEIKLLKKQLEDKNLPEKVTKPLQEHIENTVRDEIKKISKELVDSYYKGEKGRKNELIAKAPRALRYIADRIDRGATVEVHAEAPELPVAPVNKESDDGKVVIDKVYAEKLESYHKQKALADSINDRMKLISSLQRSEEAVLSIDYDKEKEEGGEQSNE